MTTIKQRRTDQIQRVILTLSRHYQVDAFRIIDTSAIRVSNATLDARKVLAYHLHRSGMSHAAIAKMLGRSEDRICRWIRAGHIRMMSPDRDMIDSLPRIESTLQISKAS